MDNKTFIENLSRKTGITRKDAGLFASSLAAAIVDICERGDIAVIPGFGSFETKKKMERIMNIPSSQGKRMLIPPKIVASFKPSALLKQRLNKIDTQNQ